MKQTIFIILVTLAISGCELNSPKPNCNIPTVLAELEFGTDEYKAITAQYMRTSKPEDYRYFFKNFHENDNQTFMTTNFRNATKCFDIDILVDDSEKLAGMKRTNGVSYPSELINLKWKILEKDGNITIVYEDMNWIQD